MPLADDIRAARDRALTDLSAAHDYFTYSIAAWELVREKALADPSYRLDNHLTGGTTSGLELAKLAQEYVVKQIHEATFQLYFSVFEVFVGDFLRAWLTAHPRAIGGKTVELKEVLDAGDVPTLLDRLIDHELAEVTYKSPRVVFQYVEKRTGVPAPPPADLDRLAEAKATRDVLVHNRGVADVAYAKKSGGLARHTPGEPMDLPTPYHTAVWELLRELVAGLAAGLPAPPGGPP